MKKRTARKVRKQAGLLGPVVTPVVGQLMLPMLVGMEATKEGLLGFMHQVGMEALTGLLGAQAEQLAGSKGKHNPGRRANHWGSCPAELTLGGRRVQVRRPRVRALGGGEVELPAFRQLAEVDPLPERVLEQLLLGVSTRGYAHSLEPLPKGMRSRGTSKSSASRHLVERTEAKAREYLSRRLDELELTGLFIDGLEVAEHTVVAALGVVADGTKVPLGLWLGSTENAVVCTALLNDLIERGLRVEGRILVTIDGGKGIRKALTQVLGDRAVVQRCQCHKTRNVLGHLPKCRHAYVRRQLRDAYRSNRVSTARKRLRQLASWLDRNGEPDAAASLREGLEETLTVLKLDLPRTLQRTFATTNPIENLNGSIRRTTRNVKRWRGGSMVRRWVAISIASAARKFRRIKGHRDMPKLIAALARYTNVDCQEKAA